ncbi:MAG: UDP-N-acetylmuramoyl-L-alanyl-D-glutamate--2,6-diaminopimelate ligase [Candidatus Pacebacteria bacterium]|nr:UDP-N-acetylmuramoyl-L-alanyl-D-glutamate--2,6-diaminopimelate ligase [Candidatus Paceibacterota bacterium]
MKLQELLSHVIVQKILGAKDVDISHISQDSRDIKENTLFVATVGTQVDGHLYISEAIEKGAIAIVCETLPKMVDSSISYILVEDSNFALANIASNFYGNPSADLKIIAITGTNGKTSIAHLLYQSLLFLGKKVAIFSTAGDFVNGEKIFLERKAPTSLELIELQKNLRMVKDDYQCEFVCLEATSHALDQNRLGSTNVSAAVFTNLSQDHLNYHKTIENYAKAKKKLFDLLPESSFALINIDDPWGTFMFQDTQARIFTYSSKNKNEVDYFYSVQKMGLRGSRFLLKDILFTSQLLGFFNTTNLVAVIGVLEQLGFSLESLIPVISDLKGAEGRMEIVSSQRQDFIAVVDYAHSPDSLSQVLDILQEISHNKIITVVGVGGGEDREKRPIMGDIAILKSDYTFFTNDNPRFDDPGEIFSDLTQNTQELNSWKVIPDRETAIREAIRMLTPGDILLVAGKGHEEYQEINGIKYPFKDKSIIEKYLTKEI